MPYSPVIFVYIHLVLVPRSFFLRRAFAPGFLWAAFHASRLWPVNCSSGIGEVEPGWDAFLLVVTIVRTVRHFTLGWVFLSPLPVPPRLALPRLLGADASQNGAALASPSVRLFPCLRSRFSAVRGWVFLPSSAGAGGFVPESAWCGLPQYWLPVLLDFYFIQCWHHMATMATEYITLFNFWLQSGILKGSMLWSGGKKWFLQDIVVEKFK